MAFFLLNGPKLAIMLNGLIFIIYLMKKFTAVGLIGSLLIAIIIPLSGRALEINLNHLISDSELTDYDSMSQIDIKNFLIQNDSVLKRMFFEVGEDKPVSATELIYRAAREHKINPKFLLVLLEKEQSLITKSSSSQRAIDFAAGYGCFTGQVCQDRWKGFHKQINSAAAQFRYYIENIEEYNFRPGKTNYVCNYGDNHCEYVTPLNVSTAALYIYTPHVHGNELFKRIWNKFFASLIYPDGSLIQAQDEIGVWYIQDGFKRPITSKAALITRFDENNILIVAKADLDSYDTGRAIEFAANTVVEIPDGTRYLLTEFTKRKVESAEVSRLLGFNPEEIETVELEEIIDITDGPNLTLNDAYPLGALIQDNTTGGVYFVENGTKHPLWSKELMIFNYPNLKIFATSPDELDQYETGGPVQFKDGLLIKAADSPDVYVISNGQRIKIADEKTFLGLGYRWPNIISTNDKSVTLHPFGGELSL